MNRCLTLIARRASLPALLISLVTLASLPVQAQMQRLFPQGVQRGQISFAEPPNALLDGRAERLAPGVRVRDERNMIALSGTLRGKTFAVNYRRDPAGLVRDIWILTPREIANPVASQQPQAAAPIHLN